MFSQALHDRLVERRRQELADLETARLMDEALRAMSDAGVRLLDHDELLRTLDSLGLRANYEREMSGHRLAA